MIVTVAIAEQPTPLVKLTIAVPYDIPSATPENKPTLKFDAVGVLEGSWDVVAGVVGAGEDVVFTPLKLVRKGVRWVVEKVADNLPF